MKVGMVKGKINAHSKNRLPGNSQHTTNQAVETPTQMDKVRVPITKITEPFKYRPKTVSLRWSQLSDELPRCQSTSAIGINIKTPINKASAVQVLNLNRTSCFRLRNNLTDEFTNWTKGIFEYAPYSHPARSNNLTASALFLPSTVRFTSSALNEPQLFNKEDLLVPIFTGYS